jgi:TM2 domain-containing membrane protein YozV
MANHPYRGLAVVFSFLLPGLGQIYDQRFAKGTIFIIAYIISWALSFIVIGWFFLVIVWIWSMVDAYQFTGRVTSPPRRAPRR